MIKKWQKFILNNYKWLICFLCLVIFIALAEDVFHHEIMNGDMIGYKLVSTYFIHDSLTPIVKIITWFGSATCLLTFTIVLFIVIKNKKQGALIGINLIIITILNQTLKFILQRPRPDKYRIINEKGYSFPSGHSMISMAFYGYLIYLIYKHINNKYLKWILISILSLFILMIGISRIYLGVHYTSDVIAGFVISIAYLIVFIQITNG